MQHETHENGEYRLTLKCAYATNIVSTHFAISLDTKGRGITHCPAISPLTCTALIACVFINYVQQRLSGLVSP